MKVLIIFECIPDYTKAYTINDPTKQEMKVINGSAGKFINGDEDTDETEILSGWIDSGDRFVECDTETPIDGPFASVVITGFYM